MSEPGIIDLSQYFNGYLELFYYFFFILLSEWTVIFSFSFSSQQGGEERVVSW